MALKQGQVAPAFTGVDQDGNKVSLKDFKGKKLVIYFYPKDNTPTCTTQACNLRDNFSLLQQHGFEVVGISPDDVASHKKFENKYQLPFPLIADPGKMIISKYGVWQQKKMFNNVYMGVVRTSFVIDEKGRILHIFHKPKSAKHAEEILSLVD